MSGRETGEESQFESICARATIRTLYFNLTIPGAPIRASILFSPREIRTWCDRIARLRIVCSSGEESGQRKFCITALVAKHAVGVFARFNRKKRTYWEMLRDERKLKCSRINISLRGIFNNSYMYKGRYLIEEKN